MNKRYYKIVGSFQKTIKKLEQLSEKCCGRVDKITADISMLSVKKVDEAAEGKLAASVVEKLKAIFE